MEWKKAKERGNDRTEIGWGLRWEVEVEVEVEME